MSGTLTLADLPIGASAKVVTFINNPVHAQRWREMGLLPGTRIKLIRLAPLGDPLEIEVRGYKLSLRKEEARFIGVESIT